MSITPSTIIIAKTNAAMESFDSIRFKNFEGISDIVKRFDSLRLETLLDDVLIYYKKATIQELETLELHLASKLLRDIDVILKKYQGIPSYEVNTISNLNMNIQ